MLSINRGSPINVEEQISRAATPLVSHPAAIDKALALVQKHENDKRSGRLFNAGLLNRILLINNQKRSSEIQINQLRDRTAELISIGTKITKKYSQLSFHIEVIKDQTEVVRNTPSPYALVVQMFNKRVEKLHALTKELEQDSLVFQLKTVRYEQSIKKNDNCKLRTEWNHIQGVYSRLMLLLNRIDFAFGLDQDNVSQLGDHFLNSVIKILTLLKKPTLNRATKDLAIREILPKLNGSLDQIKKYQIKYFRSIKQEITPSDPKKVLEAKDLIFKQAVISKKLDLLLQKRNAFTKEQGLWITVEVYLTNATQASFIDAYKRLLIAKVGCKNGVESFMALLEENLKNKKVFYFGDITEIFAQASKIEKLEFSSDDACSALQQILEKQDEMCSLNKRIELTEKSLNSKDTQEARRTIQKTNVQQFHLSTPSEYQLKVKMLKDFAANIEVTDYYIEKVAEIWQFLAFNG